MHQSSSKGLWMVLFLVAVILIAAYILFNSMQVLYSPEEFGSRTMELFVGAGFMILLGVIGLIYLVFYFIRNWT